MAPPRRQSSIKAPTDPADEPDVARALVQAASHAMDAEISPGGAALDMVTLGGTSEAKFRVLQGLTGEPPPYKSKPGEASQARRVSQHTTKISSLKITQKITCIVSLIT